MTTQYPIGFQFSAPPRILIARFPPVASMQRNVLRCHEVFLSLHLEDDDGNGTTIQTVHPEPSFATGARGYSLRGATRTWNICEPPHDKLA